MVTMIGNNGLERIRKEALWPNVAFIPEFAWMN
jgi:hypothetical protein